ncbi:VOC family protein [Streptomyces sp. NPDC026672]|uniref:VOC family protein n=1 Tax=unclassified Streptomyces TaxID=2593676 RepID=UPI0033FEC88B
MLTTRFVDGAPNWLDVGTSDIAGAVSFYGSLFGWTFRSAGPDAGGYGFFQLDGRTVAGGAQITAEQGPPAWTVYFRSGDAQATAKAVEQAHGRVLTPPMDVMGQGRMAVFADQAGVRFGIWQPALTKGVDVAGDPGSLCWTELYTADVAAAAAFYNRSLGLETAAVPFPGGTYTSVNPEDGGDESVFGGIVPLAEDPSEDTAYWLPYFEVEDPDAVAAQAERLGGTVRMAPTTLDGVGRMSKLTDPQGARFAIIRSTPPQE